MQERDYIGRKGRNEIDCEKNISEMKDQLTNTFSIIAVDPITAACGAAVASKFPAVGKIVPYVRAGVGAFCTQHQHHPIWGKEALDLLDSGRLPEEVLAHLLRGDLNSGKRQLAIIDIQGRTATRNPVDADPSGAWWGAISGKFYACQGNTLVGPNVVIAMADAYEFRRGSLADRLMAALVAGDQAGGDHRGRLAAGLRVSSSNSEDIALDVDESDDAVMELHQKYTDISHDLF